MVTATAATGPALERASASLGGVPAARSATFQPAFADPEQEGGGRAADQQGQGLISVRCDNKRGDEGEEGVAFGLHAKDGFQLAGGDQDARGGDEACDNGVRQEIGDKAQSEQAHDQKDQAGQQRQRQRGGGVADGALRGHLPHGGGGHQRDDGDRANGQRAAGAEDRIEDDRQDRGVDPGLRRQARKHGIGQRLRDQHDGDDHRRQKVGLKGVGGIVAAPCQDGQVAAGVHLGLSGVRACSPEPSASDCRQGLSAPRPRACSLAATG